MPLVHLPTHKCRRGILLREILRRALMLFANCPLTNGRPNLRCVVRIHLEKEFQARALPTPLKESLPRRASREHSPGCWN